eukprot:g45155.t1
MSDSGDWGLDEEELSSKFNSRTKAIIINTPNNPLGKTIEYTMERTNLRGDLIELYKIMRGINKVSSKGLFLKMGEFKTKGHIFEIFKMEELKMIADLCIKHDVLCISDEVYEWLVYSGHKHIKIATLPGMWERTITIGSAGKTFSVTGWKLGWSIGPAHLIKHLQTVQQNTIYTCNTPVQ